MARNYISGREGGARYAAPITPDDNNNLAESVRSIYIGGAGNLKVDLEGEGTGITFTALPVGTVLSLRVRKVYATGTTATNLIGMA